MDIVIILGTSHKNKNSVQNNIFIYTVFILVLSLLNLKDCDEFRSCYP